MRSNTRLYIVTILGSLMLSACTVTKLEARLEANPQCKDVINPKTGAVMPCPGTDKSFYRSVGLEPAKPAPAAVSTGTAVLAVDAPVNPNSSTPSSAAKTSSVTTSPQTDCKPQLHKKTGGMLPCPSPD
ncbi:hypothetical protein A8O14_05080 [Polynucleobacter wuianus]|uniref:Uncharacterized protein n=1 Tax=Polynucleobacter wuianus TaxID=1743168 RepID=A0A191UF00_9BURK|nr:MULTISPECIES: hypothetical protein [Polynucleobacter]ANI99517.1 hypothetical protein A8O14_05080 [Polynucleobacter wuianus]MBU3551859.1 hypothetical protein [Polynucleobacter sp. MWH-Post4-6-1]MBU3610828.1 hypothetical protein [Polynucleobacter wuianus]